MTQKYFGFSNLLFEHSVNFFSGRPLTQHCGQYAHVRGVPRPRVGPRGQVLDGEQGRHAARNTQIFPIHLRR